MTTNSIFTKLSCTRNGRPFWVPPLIKYHPHHARSPMRLQKVKTAFWPKFFDNSDTKTWKTPYCLIFGQREAFKLLVVKLWLMSNGWWHIVYWWWFILGVPVFRLGVLGWSPRGIPKGLLLRTHTQTHRCGYIVHPGLRRWFSSNQKYPSILNDWLQWKSCNRPDIFVNVSA